MFNYFFIIIIFSSGLVNVAEELRGNRLNGTDAGKILDDSEQPSHVDCDNSQR
jgi:hypothetical protein